MANEIGKRIKALRTERGWRQDDVAEKLHVTRQAVSNWENGKTIVSVEYLNEYAKLFKVSLDELVYGEKAAAAKEYEPMQRKYIIAAAVSLFVLLVCLVLHFTLRPWCVERYNSFETIPLLTYMLIVRFAAGISVPLLLLSSVSLLVDLRINNKQIRKAAVCIGTIPIIVMLAFFLAYFAHIIPVPIKGNILYGIFRLIKHKYMGLTIVSALLFSTSLFLFFNKK